LLCIAWYVAKIDDLKGYIEKACVADNIYHSTDHKDPLADIKLNEDSLKMFKTVSKFTWHEGSRDLKVLSCTTSINLIPETKRLVIS
jgi:hypothetical protein